MIETIAEVLAASTLILLVAVGALAAWPWRIEASAKAATRASAVSVGAGLSFAGVAASAAAILGGPGVVAVHFRGRERWRRSIPSVTLDAALAWIDELVARPAKKEDGLVARILTRAKGWLVPRTDLTSLPGLGLDVLGGLRDVELHGAITCGFDDPALTGKTAAWLYPLAGVLSPLGTLDIRFDWSGKTVIDGDVELSLRVVPARVAVAALRFARHHVHPLRRSARPATSASPASPISPSPSLPT